MDNLEAFDNNKKYDIIPNKDKFISEKSLVLGLEMQVILDQLMKNIISSEMKIKLRISKINVIQPHQKMKYEEVRFLIYIKRKNNQKYSQINKFNTNYFVLFG